MEMINVSGYVAQEKLAIAEVRASHPAARGPGAALLGSWLCRRLSARQVLGLESTRGSCRVNVGCLWRVEEARKQERNSGTGHLEHHPASGSCCAVVGATLVSPPRGHTEMLPAQDAALGAGGVLAGA